MGEDLPFPLPSHSHPSLSHTPCLWLPSRISLIFPLFFSFFFSFLILHQTNSVQYPSDLSARSWSRIYESPPLFFSENQAPYSTHFHKNSSFYRFLWSFNKTLPPSAAVTYIHNTHVPTHIRTRKRKVIFYIKTENLCASGFILDRLCSHATKFSKIKKLHS